MTKKIVLFLLIIYPQLTFGDINHINNNKYFHIGKMKSYDNEFTLYFKTRSKAIIAKGENSNYLNDYPQDLYLFDHLSNTDYPLITYEWFPKKIKKLFKNYSYPLFPEDFAYYLLNDNNTLILVSGKKSFNQNLQYNIKNNELNNFENSGKLNFIISSYAKICGYKSHDNNFECKLQKPLVSKNLIN